MPVKTAFDLKTLDKNTYVRVAGIVTLRQQPLTANGVTFISLEDYIMVLTNLREKLSGF